jgi:hypothetical protein
MKNRILAAVILIFPVALFLFFWWHPGKEKLPATGGNGSSQAVALSNALATASPQVNAVINSNFAAVQTPQKIYYAASPKPPIAAAGQARPLEFSNLPPDVVLDNLRHAIRDYGAMFGGNPVGVNSEITSQLNGRNPKQVNFFHPEAGMRTNDKGELVDPWGTPFFFHQLSGIEMQIRSAGPDKIMWTADDLATK